MHAPAVANMCLDLTDLQALQISKAAVRDTWTSSALVYGTKILQLMYKCITVFQHAGSAHLFVQEQARDRHCVPWHGHMKLDPTSEELSLFRTWIMSARKVCKATFNKAPAKLRCAEVMQEIAALLKAAGVEESILVLRPECC